MGSPVQAQDEPTPAQVGEAVDLTSQILEALAALARVRAEAGDAEAQTRLGTMYARGRGVPQDDVEAVAWFRKAAEQGLAQAQAVLGAMYAEGRGVLEDAAEAVRWYRLVASWDNLVIYSLWPGKLKDTAEAVRWFRLAAEQGHAYAQRRLGQMYATGGEGVLKDAGEAARWYRRGPRAGRCRQFACAAGFVAALPSLAACGAAAP